jgi:hypothetical protein
MELVRVLLAAVSYFFACPRACFRRHAVPARHRQASPPRRRLLLLRTIAMTFRASCASASSPSLCARARRSHLSPRPRPDVGRSTSVLDVWPRWPLRVCRELSQPRSEICSLQSLSPSMFSFIKSKVLACGLVQVLCVPVVINFRCLAQLVCSLSSVNRFCVRILLQARRHNLFDILFP